MDCIRSGHRNRYLQKGKGVLTGPFTFREIYKVYNGTDDY